MNDKIWQWIGDYCSGLMDKSEEQELRAWMDEAEENKLFFMEGVKMVREYQVVTRSDKNASDSLKHVREKIKARGRRQLWIQITAVASVVILFALSFAFFYMPELERESPVSAKVHAGGMKATLIVANGIQVDLMQDNLQDVVRQYGATVLEDKKNELRYDNVEVNEEIEEKPVYHTISTPVGGEYHFTLADGTMVWLNSSSRLTFPTRFTGDAREVLVEGEVYFGVQHDESKPFIVRVNDVSVRVLGTEFCISAYPENEGVMTTLVRGAVQVTSGNNRVVLKPGYQAVVDQYSGAISQRAVELSLYTSWVRGIFEYENMELNDIMVQLARWYDVQFTFSASECKERRFTGVIRKYEDLNDVLDMIEKTTNVKFIINGKNVTITSVTR
ncbi:FecR family protein [Butyricimonas virosa]|uniref:FecR family protein n=1 Tax=Butyricimonas virosa TaxID=544645 RepID=UPI00242FFD79|nr:FecR domain-containing protein [Butyricimonas virosa]